MASDIWLWTILTVREETRCCHIGYSFRLQQGFFLYASSHRQDNTYHGLCYTSRGALAGTRNSSMGPPHEGLIHRSYHGATTHNNTLLQPCRISPGKLAVLLQAVQEGWCCLVSYPHRSYTFDTFIHLEERTSTSLCALSVYSDSSPHFAHLWSLLFNMWLLLTHLWPLLFHLWPLSTFCESNYLTCDPV